ncbi:MAG: 6-bladed beta-propeller [Bacteroidales bacterium]
MKLYLYIIITCFLFYSCGNISKKEAITVAIDLNQSEELNVSTSLAVKRCVLLDQSTAGSLLAVITNFYVQDTCYVFLSGGRMRMFNGKGEVLSGLPMQGRGPEEYNSIWTSWLSERLLYMFDMNSSKMFQYNFVTMSNTVLNLPQKREMSFQFLIPDKKGYVGKLVFGGASNTTPELGRFDDSLKFIKAIGPLKLSSGVKLAYSFAKHGKEILYWRPLENNIYAIDSSDSLKIKYTIDFGPNTFHITDNIKDDYDIIDGMNKKKEKYAGIIQNVYESDKILSFSFVHNTNLYAAIYNKKNAFVQTYKLIGNSPELKIASLCFKADRKLSAVTVDEKGTYKVHDIEL